VANHDAPISWGVLSTANIAVEKVIPAMKKSELSRVDGIASRSADRAMGVAAELDIPRSYGSYEELLADSDIDAVYIPLPNHLHAEWTIAVRNLSP
jgi:xylose dehydrogenase (NAD/NADP)